MTPTSTVRLADGRSVRLRRAVPADVAAIVALFAGLSDASARMRFAGARPGPALLARFAAVDGPQRVGSVVAIREGPDPVVGEARYVPRDGSVGALAGDERAGPELAVAELAVTVRDDHQGLGLGRLLLAAVIGRAAAASVQRLRAEVLVSNAPMLALLAPFGRVLVEPTRDCTVYLDISTRGGVPGWDERVPGRRRVLVEGGSWYDDARTSRLRAAGDEVRRCLGPRRAPGASCPLLTGAGCRLAEQADVIVAGVSRAEPLGQELLEAHERHWPERLV